MQNLKNILYLDIETQYLITDFPGGWKRKENYKEIKIAELGTLQNNVCKYFEEDNINDLKEEIINADLIVGHNINQFDYEVLKCYFSTHEINVMKLKTFDTMIEFNKHTLKCGWVSLNDIAQKNFGMKKTDESIKIPEMWRNGEIDRVKHYLLNDLKMTEQFYLCGKKGHNFKYTCKIYGVNHGEREIYIKW